MLARFALAAATALVIPTCAFAAPESWRPTSNTAEQFIGPLRFSPDRIDFHRGRFMQLAPAGTAPFVDETGARVNATVYRVTAKSPDDGLCEGKAAFVLVWQSPPVGAETAPRAINAFRGNRFVMGSPDDCGVFRFDAGRRR